jgi:hypothetical protein
LRDDLPIIIALVEAAIEEVLGVETAHTVYEKHLYELAGFKAVFGLDTVRRVSRGEAIADNVSVDMPNIDVRLRDRPAYLPLTGMVIDKLWQADDAVAVRYKSEDGLVIFQFRLAFADERLNFDMFEDVLWADNGSPRAAENIAEVLRFRKEYFANGRLQIQQAETGEVISRKDAYLPMNMRMNHDVVEAEIATWRQRAQERRDRNLQYAEALSSYGKAYIVCAPQFGWPTFNLLTDAQERLSERR